MTDLEHDAVRAFAMAIPYRLRQQLRLDYETWPVIRDAVTNTGNPQQLAKTCIAGITRQHANPWPIIWRRLRRAAGQPDDFDTEPQPAKEVDA